MTSRPLCEILNDVSHEALNIQSSNGSFLSGQNGPHGDPETPVRTTSHYLILLSHLYERTRCERFRQGALDAIGFLTEDEARPHGYTFHHRWSEKDQCNGIVGQAWTIEALAETAVILDKPELVNIAEEVFLLHPFDDRLGIWKRVEINGDVLCFDSTLNHQIWFAAAGGLLSKYHDVEQKIDQQVVRFLDRLDDLIELSEDGLIKGGSLPYREYPYALRSDSYGRIVFADIASKLPLFFESNFIRSSLLNYTPLNRLPSTKTEKKEKAIGYHSFHLYGLAMLKTTYPGHEVWTSNWLKQALEYAESSSYISELDESSMGYPYNISGVEMAFVHDVFRGGREVQRQWLQRQFDHTWDSEDEMLSRNTPDPRTLTARLYEATRLSDYDFEIELPDTSKTS